MKLVSRWYRRYQHCNKTAVADSSRLDATRDDEMLLKFRRRHNPNQSVLQLRQCRWLWVAEGGRQTAMLDDRNKEKNEKERDVKRQPNVISDERERTGGEKENTPGETSRSTSHRTRKLYDAQNRLEPIFFPSSFHLLSLFLFLSRPKCKPFLASPVAA